MDGLDGGSGAGRAARPRQSRGGCVCGRILLRRRLGPESRTVPVEQRRTVQTTDRDSAVHCGRAGQVAAGPRAASGRRGGPMAGDKRCSRRSSVHIRWIGRRRTRGAACSRPTLAESVHRVGDPGDRYHKDPDGKKNVPPVSSPRRMTMSTVYRIGPKAPSRPPARRVMSTVDAPVHACGFGHRDDRWRRGRGTLPGWIAEPVRGCARRKNVHIGTAPTTSTWFSDPAQSAAQHITDFVEERTRSPPGSTPGPLARGWRDDQQEFGDGGQRVVDPMRPAPVESDGVPGQEHELNIVDDDRDLAGEGDDNLLARVR